MRKTIVIVALFVAVAAVFTSCASSRGSRGGCNMSRGYVGYGGGGR